LIGREKQKKPAFEKGGLSLFRSSDRHFGSPSALTRAGGFVPSGFPDFTFSVAIKRYFLV